MPRSPVTLLSLLQRHGSVTPCAGGRYLVSCAGPGRFLRALHARRLAAQFGLASTPFTIAGGGVCVYLARVGPPAAWPSSAPVSYTAAPALSLVAAPAAHYSAPAAALPSLIVCEVVPYAGPLIHPRQLRPTLFFRATFAASTSPGIPLGYSLIAAPTTAKARRQARAIAATIAPARVAARLQVAFPASLFPVAA